MSEDLTRFFLTVNWGESAEKFDDNGVYPVLHGQVVARRRRAVGVGKDEAGGGGIALGSFGCERFKNRLPLLGRTRLLERVIKQSFIFEGTPTSSGAGAAVIFASIGHGGGEL